MYGVDFKTPGYGSPLERLQHDLARAEFGRRTALELAEEWADDIETIKKQIKRLEERMKQEGEE